MGTGFKGKGLWVGFFIYLFYKSVLYTRKEYLWKVFSVGNTSMTTRIATESVVLCFLGAGGD